jgi:heme/copper-type cytochrome/quinol oxidase subunit 2
MPKTMNLSKPVSSRVVWITLTAVSIVLVVLIYRLNGQAKAYPVEKLPADGVVSDMVGGTPVRVSYAPKSRQPRVVDAKGENVPYVLAYWFAWQAFYPETELWKPAP